MKAGPRRTVLGMVLKGYPRISEVFISNEILLLEQLGFKIHIFSMRQPRETFSHASVRGVQAAVDYLPHTLLTSLPRLLPANLGLARQEPQRYAAALRLALRRLARRRKTATVKHLLQAGYLVQRLMPGRDIAHLHAHFAHSPTSVAMFTAWLAGRGFSFTAHAKDIYTSQPRQLREKIAAARFVVTCTGYSRGYLHSLAPRAATPVYRVYHGIDLRLFDGDGGGRNPQAPYRILTVARLTRKKGLPTVLRAVRYLRDQGMALEHVLIGDGDDRRALLSLVRSLGLEGTTRWLGTQPHEVVLQHYRRADLFVLGCEVAPNGDRDGIPNVLLESMAMGVPVVATRVAAIPELVADGENGLLVTPGRPQKLARAMQRLLEDHPLRRRVIAAGRDRVRSDFDNRALIRRLGAILSQQVPELARLDPAGGGTLPRLG